jgi:ABC-type multidrug transport system ATPase subunit
MLLFLAGHNGAGKTTLSHMLACDFAPSEGNATIFGHSVSSEPDAIRKLVGICQQDDCLWPDLSAKEHLELFAGLRGVPKLGVDLTVQTWLESVDLVDVQLQFSATFSGGMKRRLSVALSTIGDRPFIILVSYSLHCSVFSDASFYRCLSSQPGVLVFF